MVFFTCSRIVGVGLDAGLVLLLDDHSPQLIRKVLLSLLSLRLERVDVSLSNYPDLNLFLGSPDYARHAQVRNGQTEFKIVDWSSLLI